MIYHIPSYLKMKLCIFDAQNAYLMHDRLGAPQTKQQILHNILYRTYMLLAKVFAAMHDQKSSSARFTSHFNGNTKNTIRFIFAIQRYDTISRFMDPDSLFHAVYNNIADHIKPRFAGNKATVVTRQKAALTAESSDTDKEKAAIYTLNSMQKFFMKHYRPSITHGNVFRELKSIRMRYNENPRTVLDRVVTAISNARHTIGLYNNAGVGIPLGKITHDDRTHILTTVFCTKNNSKYEKNDGGVNALVQKTVRQKELQYKSPERYNPWYTAIDAICAKVGGVHYAGDELYKYVHHDPQVLPLWDDPPRSKPRSQRRPTPTKRKNPYKPVNNPRPKYQRSSSHPNHRSPTKYTPSKPNNPNTDSSKITCFRCGRIGHRATDCYSKTDINGYSMRKDERRQLKQMPYRGDYKPPKSSSKPSKQPYNPRPSPSKYQPRNPRQFHTKNAPRGQGGNNSSWMKYPTQSNPPQYNPNPAPQSNPNSQPQIHALLAKIQANVAMDPHTDPTIIQDLQSLTSMVDPNNGSSGHDPQ